MNNTVRSALADFNSGTGNLTHGSAVAPSSADETASPLADAAPPPPVEPPADYPADTQAAIEAAARRRGVQAAAVALAAQSFLLARILPGEKRPRNAGWTTKSADPASFTEGDNLGLLCGVIHRPDLGGWYALVNIDLDSADAVARADEFLPRTAMVEGRRGKPRSHHWYLIPLDSIPEWAFSTAPQASAAAREKCGHPGPATRSFRGLNNKEAIRFCGTGAQANVPPSRHESGELREWDGGERGEPAVVSFAVLWQAVCDLALAIGCGPPSEKAPGAKRSKKATASVGADSAAPAAGIDDATTDTTDDPEDEADDLDGENPFALPEAERAATERRVIGFLNAIPAEDLPFDGSAGVEGRGGGSLKTAMIVGQLIYGFQRSRADAIRLIVDYVNPRLGAPNRPWAEADIARMVDWLIARGPDGRFPVGKLLDKRPLPKTRAGARQDAGAPPGAQLVYSTLAGVSPKPLTFLVPEYVPAGMLGMIAGEGGHGKSQITLDLIAAISTGKCPFGLDYPERVVGSSILIACEDDWERTTVPRLVARGADLSKVYRIDGLKLTDGGVLDFNLSHAKQLREMVETIGDVKLIVVDPAGAFVGRANVDEHKDAELRALLGPLSELANATGATVLLVKHLNKNAGVSAVHRVGGSVAYVNAVRFYYLVTPDLDDAGRKLLLPAKANILPGDLKGRAYRIDALPEAEAHAVLTDKFPTLTATDRSTIAKQLIRTNWEAGAVDIDANAATAAPAGRRPAGQLDACKVIIRDFLGAYSRPVADLDSAAGLAFPAKVVKEAKKQLRELPAGNPDRLWTRPLKEGGKWWAWIGPDPTPRPPIPRATEQSVPQPATPDETGETVETAGTATTAPQGGVGSVLSV